jgi:osmotically-inducible protein OsmY
MRKTLVALTFVAFVSSGTSYAQIFTGGTGGNTGGMGGGSLGGGGMGGSSFGGNSMGGNSFGGGSVGGSRGSSSGTFGSRTMGGGATRGQRSFGGRSGVGAQASGQVGNISGNERFLRGNRQGQFVGGDAASMQSFIGSLQAGQGRNNMGMGNQLNGGGRRNNGRNVNNEQQQGQSRSREERYRPTLRIGFDPPAPSPSRISDALTTRLQKSTRLEFVSPPQVAMSGRTAILTGEVATDHDRSLAEQVVLLEAGVSQVQNNLTVRQSDSDAAASAAPATSR